MFDFYLKHNRKRKARKMVDLDIEEISLCDKVATGKRFYVIKQAEQDELIALIAKALGDDFPEEAKAKVKDLSPEAAKAIKDALETLDKYSEVFDSEAKDALKVLLTMGLSGYGQAGGGYPKPKDESKDEAEIETKSGDSLKFFKGGVTGLDVMLGGLMAFARENKRRSDPRHDDGFIFKADEGDDEPDETSDDADDSQQHGVSKALRGQDSDEGDSEPVDNFPSFQFPVFPRDRVVRGRVL